ncbi:pyridoxal-phosphate dependent enzyme [Dactylosporangium sp. McL0621]|uniref:pyridoxal-phosphate dependent enzyme n=1 Tax=Dactylosporangium sp. McL0621 TaxID=3415678 RepID=UPI003CF5B5F2
MEFHESVLDLIGHTPLVRLRRVAAGLAPTVLAKLESFNPGGSAKDRIALRMVDAAERAGLLRPGGTIVEPTSGNTGVGLALVAQQRGYRCVFTCPDKVSPDKIAVLRAYGAEVVVCPSTVPPEHPDFYRNTAARLAAERPGAYRPDQYANAANPESHYHSTGPEIWAQTAGRVTCFVAGVGTGGTISGTGRYLKEVSGGRVRVVGADPDGSVYSGRTLRPYLVEGVGQPSLPGSFDPGVPDEILAVHDREAVALTRRLALEEGILTGGSGGMAVAAALAAAGRLGPDDVVVVIVPDSGRGYLSKLFNDEWLGRSGFTRDAAGPHLADVLAAGPGRPGPAEPGESVGVVLKTMAGAGVRELLVSRAPHPVRAAEVLGTAREASLVRRLARGEADLGDPVGEHLGPPLPTAGAGQSLDRAVALLDGGDDALTVLDAGVVLGVVTAHDIAQLLRDPMGVRRS